MKTFLFIWVASLVIFFNPSLAQWEELGPKNGLPAYGSESYFGLVVDGKNIVTNTLGEMYISTNNGDSWELTNYKPSAAGNVPYLLGVKDSNIFVSIRSDYQVSHDLGRTWKVFNNYGDTAHQVSTGIIFNGDVGIAGGCCAISKTTDFGETFKKVLGNGWDNIGYSPVLLKDGYFFAKTGLFGAFYRSKDNGDTWDTIELPRPGNAGDAKYVGFKLIKNLIIAFDSDRDRNTAIFSTDNGDTWDLKKNYSKFLITDHFISCGDNLYGMGGPEEGVYLSRDTGQTWTSFNKGLRLYGDIKGLVLAHDDKYLFATFEGYVGGGGRGLYRAKMKDCEIDFSSDVAVQHEAENVNIYPNPVSDFLYLPKISSNGRIKIYSTIGICISEFDPGEKIDVSGLAPGLYFVQLGVQIQKFIKVN